MNQMTTLTASLVLTLAIAHERLNVEAAWAAAHVDEDWQIAQWGEDAPARQRREAQWADMAAAAPFPAALAGELIRAIAACSGQPTAL